MDTAAFPQFHQADFWRRDRAVLHQNHLRNLVMRVTSALSKNYGRATGALPTESALDAFDAAVEAMKRDPDLGALVLFGSALSLCPGRLREALSSQLAATARDFRLWDNRLSPQAVDDLLCRVIVTAPNLHRRRSRSLRTVWRVSLAARRCLPRSPQGGVPRPLSFFRHLKALMRHPGAANVNRAQLNGVMRYARALRSAPVSLRLSVGHSLRLSIGHSLRLSVGHSLGMSRRGLVRSLVRALLGAHESTHAPSSAGATMGGLQAGSRP